MPAVRALAVLVVVLLTLSGCLGAVPAAAPTGSDVDTSGQPTLPVVIPEIDGCAVVAQRGRPGSAGDAQTLLPELTLPCLTDGPGVAMARLGGRPTVVNLWATWCVPCRQEMPALQAAHSRYRDVQFLGVDTKDRNDWAQEFLPLVNVRYPQVVDTDGRLLAALRSPGLPVTVVLDRDGRIVGRQIGRISDTELEQLIATARG
jgi:cytochrome c biogenesis protein CcmG/thiol:disulfide interchange protein DsbE